MNKEKNKNKARWFGNYKTRDSRYAVRFDKHESKTVSREPAACGFTLIEMMISMVVMIIATFTIGAIIANGQSGWSAMYDKIHSDVVTDGFSVRKKFDGVMRKASSDKIFIGADNSSVEVYYYSSGVSTVVDRYVRFYESGGDLNLEYGTLDPKVTLNVETVCSNVTNCTFHQFGRATQMILTLDNGTQKNTVITSAVTNN